MEVGDWEKERKKCSSFAVRAGMRADPVAFQTLNSRSEALSIMTNNNNDIMTRTSLDCGPKCFRRTKVRALIP